MKPWKKTEIEVAITTGGRRQPASGAIDGAAGDVEVDRSLSPRWWDGVVYECKNTRNKQFTLTDATYKKVFLEATSQGKLAVMVHETAGMMVATLDYQILVQLIERVRRLEIAVGKELFDAQPE